MPEREATPLDQEVFDAVLAEEVAKGTDRRVAEGRARAAAVRAYRRAHPEPGGAAAAAPTAAAAPDGGGARPAAVRPAAAPVPGGGVVYAPKGPVATGAAAAPTATIAAPAPTVTAPPPVAPERQRLLSLAIPEGIQRVEREQGDRVSVFPHLLIEEFVALLIVLAAVTLFATFVNAPLRELANPNLTPNPSKAPWYFVGLQELLHYFHPMVAGIVIPTVILIGLMTIPYVDRNPSTKPGDRKLAIALFTMLFMFGATLTIIGSFFRGPGFTWVWPWSQGLFFDL